MKHRKAAPQRRDVEIINAHPNIGLTRRQVQARMDGGWAAGKPRNPGQSEREIILTHVFTFFNLIFVLLAALLVIGGSSVKNMTFLIVAVCNAVIGIIQEIRAKRAVDKLTLISRRSVTVLRDSARQEIPAEELVRDDILLLQPGDTIPADGILRAGQVQVDESLITGESDAIGKEEGSGLLSGSIVLSGHGRMQLTAVGADSFAARLTAEAKANPKAAKSEMMHSLDKLIRVVGMALIPVGLLLFYQQFAILQLPLRESVEGTVAALVGMIPEGLYLLTSMAMAASALKLSREQVLVQDLNCIESLARVDVLCVDKTGTITENTMAVEQLIPLKGTELSRLEAVLTALYSGEDADNDTARAMAARFGGKTDWNCEKRIPFSSAYKWSGAVFAEQGAFIVGAPEFLLGEKLDAYRETIEHYADEGCRVLLAATYGGNPIPGGLEYDKIFPLGFCLLTSPIRENARETFDYFEAQGVSIRVISGDSARTASQVARRAGVSGAERYIDASTLASDEELALAAEKYNVFGRVTPDQKKKLIAALQSQGHTVAMTGDGVNDLLAMKQADCSIAMSSGAQAASQIASLVLLHSDFAAMPGIVAEGRRVINNIQRSATLFLVKNIFSALLALLSLVLGWAYPFEPIHLTLVASLTIGIPAFFLAMEPSYQRISGGFLRTVLRRAFPGGITNVFMVLIAQVCALVFGLQSDQTGTICAAILATVGLMVLFQVCRPFDKFRKMIWCAMAGIMVVCFLFFGSLFELRTGTMESNLILTALVLIAPAVFRIMLRLLNYGEKICQSLRSRKTQRK